jgi:hypothetical protein
LPKLIFLSYAEEDASAAARVSGRLQSEGFDVYDWAERRGGRFIKEIEEHIQRADGFVVLLSPSFMTSPWCHRERDLALQREQDLQAQSRDALFLYVLRVVDGDYADAGFLRGYDWPDLTEGSNSDSLDHLARRLRTSSQGVAMKDADDKRRTPMSPLFRNRSVELDKVLRGLTNPGGKHFWLVIAPPQLGKTWFLDRIAAELAEAEPGRWTARLVDLRQRQPELRGDARGILDEFFPAPRPARKARKPGEIAAEILESGKSRLCLLDSAELLDQRTANTVRSALSQVYRHVQDGGDDDTRLALVVASRREDEWRGVTPSPRLTELPLTEFNMDIVQQALRDLAAEMGRKRFGTPFFVRHAASVHHVSEGLPALLVRCLQWIRGQQWVNINRLKEDLLFAELAHPYIRDSLLSADSLVPMQPEPDGEPRRALMQAFRVLAPYRLFTQSHLRYHLDSDATFERAMADAGWSIEDLWKAIGATALLTRPLNEPWQEMQPAIRRLLCRYYHASGQQCASAHRDARKFVEAWTHQQAGKELVVGLTECLWHEGVELRLLRPADMRGDLTESAKAMVRALTESSAYTANELRCYAAERLRNDEEFRNTISPPAGLHTALADIVQPT